MAYPGLGLALFLGLAIGGILFYMLHQEEQQQEQHQQSYSRNRNSPPLPTELPSSRPQPRRFRRRRRQDCLVCFKPLTHNVTELKCKHSYHKDCIQLFRQRESRVCAFPMCDENSNITECSICLEPMLYHKKMLACGHSFHFICIEGWFKESKNCPFRCT